MLRSAARVSRVTHVHGNATRIDCLVIRLRRFLRLNEGIPGLLYGLLVFIFTSNSPLLACNRYRGSGSNGLANRHLNENGASLQACVGVNAHVYLSYSKEASKIASAVSGHATLLNGLSNDRNVDNFTALKGNSSRVVLHCREVTMARL